ncbi:MAG: VOC family protein [Planctomycetota bacterium]
MHHRFNHIELVTDDTRKARDFYAALFRWQFTEMPSPVPGGVYTYIHTGEGATGGLVQKAMPQAPNAWLSYVLVENVADTLTAALTRGGTVVVPQTAVPTGAFAVLADPTGAVFGVFEDTRK